MSDTTRPTRRFRPGDRVGLTGTVTSVGADPIDGTPKMIYVKFDDALDEFGFDVGVNDRALNLLEPAEPPVGSVVVFDNIAYTRWWAGDSENYNWESSVPSGSRKWSDISDGTVIYVPIPEEPVND